MGLSSARLSAARLARFRTDSAARVAAHHADVARGHAADSAVGELDARPARIRVTRLSRAHAGTARRVATHFVDVARVLTAPDALRHQRNETPVRTWLSRRRADTAAVVAADVARSANRDPANFESKWRLDLAYGSCGILSGVFCYFSAGVLNDASILYARVRCASRILHSCVRRRTRCGAGSRFDGSPLL